MKNHGPVDQLAIDRHCACAKPRGGNDSVCPIDLRRARRKAAIDGCDLRGVNAELSAKTELFRANYIGFQCFRRLDVDSHALDRRNPVRPRLRDQ